MFISSSSQPKILTIYTHSFLVFHYFYYVLYNYLLYSFFLLFALPTTLQVIIFSFIKLNRFCVFVAFLLYIIWFLLTSFINRLKFYVWSHLLVFFLEVNIASNIFVFFNFILHDYLLSNMKLDIRKSIRPNFYVSLSLLNSVIFLSSKIWILFH